MRAIQILLLCISLTVAADAGDRKYAIDSQKEMETIKKALLAQLAPLIVLREMGMPIEDATRFMRDHINGAMVEGHEAQIDYNYRHAQRVLADLPTQYSNAFMRLTYQWVGPSSLLRKEVAQEIDLTLEQKKNVQSVYFDYVERMAPANRSDFSYQMTPDERGAYHERTKQIHSDRDRALLDVLTPNQLEIWNSMVGENSPALESFRQSLNTPR